MKWNDWLIAIQAAAISAGVVGWYFDVPSMLPKFDFRQSLQCAPAKTTDTGDVWKEVCAKQGDKIFCWWKARERK